MSHHPSIWARMLQTRAPAPPPASLTHDELLAVGHPLAKCLPVAALKKFESLVAQRDRLHSPVRQLSERARDITEQIGRQQLQDEREEAAEVRIATAEQRDVANKRRHVALSAMRAQRAELNRQIEEINAEAAGLTGLVNEIEEYVRACVTAPPAMYPNVKPPSGDPLRAIAQAKAAIDDLRKERAAIDCAPWPSAVVKARALADIDAAAARGIPDTFRSIEENKPIRWPTIDPRPGLGRERTVDSFGLMAWMFRDRLVEMTMAEIDARADDGAALNQQEREARHADVARRLLAAERILEAAIEAAGPSGMRHRTRDADPRSVLGLADDAPAPKVR